VLFRSADGTHADQVLGKLDEAEALVDSTIGSVQRIANELRPSALDSLGLASAVRDEARRFSERAGIGCEVHVDGTVQPPPQVSTAFFRILQELLTNVARHARAHHVIVTLSAREHDWRMEVADDGRGIDADDAGRHDALGLLGMSERATAVGGQFQVGPASTGGTLARVTVPHEPVAT
jgi:two-component system sensor histidine kinase UhpB